MTFVPAFNSSSATIDELERELAAELDRNSPGKGFSPKKILDLIARGASPDTHGTENGETALAWAARNNEVEAVKTLLRRGASPILKGGYGGEAPVITAALNGNTEIVGLFLDNGVSPDFQDSGGITPLIAAAKKGHTETMQMLKDRGAKPYLKNDMGDTADWILYQNRKGAEALALNNSNAGTPKASRQPQP